MYVAKHDNYGDIVAARYGEGELTTDDFDNGESGNAVKLTNSGIATYEATAGTYTFYVLDSKGNEAVKVIQITERQNRQNYGGRPSGMPMGYPGGMPGQGYGMPNQMDMWFEEMMSIGFDEIFNYIRQFR